MVRSHYVLASLDSGTSHCFILDRSLASHYILVFMDTSWETSTSSGLVIAYIIDRLYHYMRSVSIKQYPRVRTSGRQSYGIFQLEYSNSDHDFFNYVYGTQVFSEQICSQVTI